MSKEIRKGKKIFQKLLESRIILQWSQARGQVLTYGWYTYSSAQKLQSLPRQPHKQFKQSLLIAGQKSLEREAKWTKHPPRKRPPFPASKNPSVSLPIDFSNFSCLERSTMLFSFPYSGSHLLAFFWFPITNQMCSIYLAVLTPDRNDLMGAPPKASKTPQKSWASRQKLLSATQPPG